MRAHHGRARDPPALPLAHLQASNQKRFSKRETKETHRIKSVESPGVKVIRFENRGDGGGARGGSGAGGGGRRPAGRGRRARVGGAAGGAGSPGGYGGCGRGGGSPERTSAWRRGRAGAAAAAAGARGAPSFSLCVPFSPVHGAIRRQAKMKKLSPVGRIRKGQGPAQPAHLAI